VCFSLISSAKAPTLLGGVRTATGIFDVAGSNLGTPGRLMMVGSNPVTGRGSLLGGLGISTVTEVSLGASNSNGRKRSREGAVFSNSWNWNGEGAVVLLFSVGTEGVEKAPGILTARGIGGGEITTFSGGNTNDEMEILCELLLTAGSSGVTTLTGAGIPMGV
jgi:hypothetical protein